MTYNIDLCELRAVSKGPKRYVKMRAVANGVDSYNSIFTQNARESIVRQLKGSSVHSKMLHKDTVLGNVKVYLESQFEKAQSEMEKKLTQTLLGQLPMAEFPPATIVDAEFESNGQLVVTSEFNEELASLPEEKLKLDTYWNLLENRKIGGASLVFSEVRSFKQGDKLFIDDLRVDGIDFVDRPSHMENRILETFVRAASEALPVEHKVEEKVEMVEMRMADMDIKKIDDVVKDVSEIKQNLEAEKKAKLDAELKAKEEAVQAEIITLKKQLEQKDTELNELEAVAKEAVKKLQDFSKPSTAATVVNPYAQPSTPESTKPMTREDLIKVFQAGF